MYLIFPHWSKEHPFPVRAGQVEVSLQNQTDTRGSVSGTKLGGQERCPILIASSSTCLSAANCARYKCLVVNVLQELSLQINTHRGNKSLSWSHIQSCQLEWHSFTVIPMIPNNTLSFICILNAKVGDI